MTPKLSSLTDDEIRVLIGQTIGWTPRGNPSVKGLWHHPSEKYKLLERSGMLPAFTYDANAALTLCDWMKERGFFIMIDNNSVGWECEFFDREEGDPMRKSYYAEALTLPLAISHAFLLANNLAEL